MDVFSNRTIVTAGGIIQSLLLPIKTAIISVSGDSDRGSGRLQLSFLQEVSSGAMERNMVIESQQKLLSTAQSVSLWKRPDMYPMTGRIS